jgi:hypothetical protein
MRHGTGSAGGMRQESSLPRRMRHAIGSTLGIRYRSDVEPAKSAGGTLLTWLPTALSPTKGCWFATSTRLRERGRVRD